MHVGTPVLNHSTYQRDSPPDHLQQVQLSVAAQAHHRRGVLVGARDAQHRTDASQALRTHLPPTHHDDRHTEAPGLHLFPSTGWNWSTVQPTRHGRASKTHWSYYTGTCIYMYVHVQHRMYAPSIYPDNVLVYTLCTAHTVLVNQTALELEHIILCVSCIMAQIFQFFRDWERVRIG